MTKEELKQEAEEWIIKNSKEFITNPNYSPFDYAEGIYLAGAEPREKQIQIDAEQIRALQKQNAELKADNDARKFAMAMSEKVEKQLREENTKLKDVIEGYKKIAKWCDKCDKIAELKSENQKWKDEWQEQVQKATDEGYARTLQTIQLTKAKDLLLRFIELKNKPCASGHSINMLLYENICVETEQFISEV